MAAKSNWFKVATAGPTVDGREIKASWLTDMATTYDVEEYCASIFQDHYGWYGNYGQVTALKSENDDKGRVCLFAQIKANKMLLALNSAGQKLFTSIRVVEDFGKTGKAYLMHLAITDEPASLGTQQLSFSVNGEDSQIFLDKEGVAVDFNTPQTDEELAAEVQKRPGFLTRFFNKQTSPEKDDDDMSKADKETLEKLSGDVTAFKKQLEEFTKQDAGSETDEPNEFATKIKELEGEITSLKEENQSFKGLDDKFKKLESDLADAMKDATTTPPKDKGEAEDSFQMF